MPQEVESIYAETFNINQRREECHHSKGEDFPWCTFGGNDIRAIVVGDSHAASVVTAVQAALGGDDADPHSPGILYSSHSSCPTLFDIKRETHDWTCAKFNDFLAEKIADLPASIPVIIVNSGGYFQIPDVGETLKPTVYFDKPHEEVTPEFIREYQQAMIASTCRLAADHAVYLLRPIPAMPGDVPRVMARRALLGLDGEMRITRDEYVEDTMAIWEVQDIVDVSCNVEVLDTAAYLCDETFCYGSEAGRPLYYDSGHISEYGNRKLIPMFENLGLTTDHRLGMQADRTAPHDRQTDNDAHHMAVLPDRGRG
nr:SGNH hydrolase domain-containing protein [Halomonas populi]